MTVYRNTAYFKHEHIPFHAEPYELTPGMTIETHSHEFVEFVYIAEGSGTHVYNDCAYPVGSGDVFLIDPKARHAYHVKNTQSMKVINVLFLPIWISSELQALNQFPAFIDFFYKEPFLRAAAQFQSKLTVNGPAKVKLEQRLVELIAEYDKASSGWDLLCKWKFAEILMEVSRDYEQQTQRSSRLALDSPETIEKMCEYIRIHYARPLTLAQVCRMCGMSQSSFTSRFKAHTGQTFVEYRNRVRIEAAKTLLAGDHGKMLDIAAEVGFEDLSLFNKTFKKFTGSSPRDWKRRL